MARRVNSDIPTQQLAAILASRHPRLWPVLHAVHRDDGVWLVSPLPPGTPLRRLLSFARLTPRQAALLASDIRDGVRKLHGGGHGTCWVTAETVRVTSEGNAVLTDWAAGALAGPPDEADDPVAVLLAELHGGLCSPRNGSTPDAFLRESLAEGDADAVSHAVATDGTNVRAAIGALVTAWTGASPEWRTPPQQVPTRQRVPAPYRREDRPSLRLRVWRRTWPPLAALVVLAIVVGIGATTLRDQVTENLHLLLDRSQTPHASGHVPAEGTPPLSPDAISPKVPHAKGVVRGVQLRAEHACRPGSRCPVTLSVHLRHANKPVTVRWSLQVVDRCDGTSTRPGKGTMRVPAGSGRVVTTRTVRLPHRQALDVFAVTKKPERVSSTPLPVPAKNATCR
ncbi:MAG: hypothetical protein ACRDMV_20490 [Streptosporangiales bacterium]